MRIRDCVLVIALLAPARAWAQRPVTLNVGGGVSLPTGDFGNVATTGWHALAGIGVSSLMQAWGVRLDASYNQFGTDIGGNENPSVTSGTLNFTYRLPMTNSPLSPYIITGAGAYRFGCSGSGCGSSTRFGWNAGLGTKFTGLHLRGFLEARFHAANTGGVQMRYVPVTLGLML